jgi:NHLM bacteriocin system ABC transporter ATP-binding protein
MIDEANAVDSDAPRLLDTPGTAWRIVAGEVLLGAVPAKHVDAAGNVHGSVLRIGGIPAGDAMFGGRFASGGGDWIFVAHAAPGTVVVPLTFDTYSPANRDAICSHYLKFLIDSTGAKTAFSPTKFLEKDPLAFSSDDIVRARRRVGFARVISGEPLYNGTLPLAVGDVVMLTDHVWLTTAGNAEIEAIGRSSDVDTAERFDAIARVHALFGLLLEARERALDAQRATAITQSLNHDRVTLARGLGALTDVLQSDVVHLDADAGPLVRAAELVAYAGGTPLTIASGHTYAGLAGLYAIANAANVRVRMIELPARWWEAELEPFLTFRLEDAQPIAILPHREGKTRYVMVDPMTGAREAVTAENAAALPGEVYTIVRPLPDKPLKLSDLVAFAFRGAGRDVLGTLGLGLVGGLLATTTPIAIGLLFDQIVPSAERVQLGLIVVGLVVFAITAAVAEFVRSMLVVRIQARFGATLQQALMERLVSLPAEFFRRFGVGDLAQRVLGIDQIEQYVSDVTISAALSGLFSLFSLALIFIYDPPIALLAVVIAIVALAVLFTQAFIVARYSRLIAERSGRVATDVLQMIDGIAKLRVANAETRAFVRWLDEFIEQRRAIVGNARAMIGFTTFARTWPIFAAFAVIAFVVFHNAGTLDAGTYLTVNAALGQFLGALFGLGDAAASTAQTIPIYERAKPFLDAVPERDATRRDPGQLRGGLTLTDVVFRYVATGPPTLDGISFSVQPGQFVAIVGPSGSGKSTLMRLLLGFEKPESGTVAFDGRDLASLDLGAVRRQIGTVLQSSRLIPGSIYENIAAGRILTPDEAWDAARAVGIAPDIAAMPMQMQTYIGGTGGGLSGGQRQRLAIARAIATSPRLLLFDEATSALDNATQAIVTATLAELNATRIVIAHRLSTIVGADTIIVVAAGRVVQQGSYAELMAQEGLFAELARRQVI